MDATNSWWVSELLAADFFKAWLHSEWEEAMQRWYNQLYGMKKEDKESREEVEA